MYNDIDFKFCYRFRQILYSNAYYPHEHYQSMVIKQASKDSYFYFDDYGTYGTAYKSSDARWSGQKKTKFYWFTEKDTITKIDLSSLNIKDYLLCLKLFQERDKLLAEYANKYIYNNGNKSAEV